MDRIHYLYKIINLVNNKIYIGVTFDPEARKKQHFNMKNKSSLVSKAIRKHGVDNFSFEVICVGDRNFIFDLEEKAIDLYKSKVSGHGYNIADGGAGGSKPRRGKVGFRKDDKPEYVAGFWFPNKRLAMNSLNLTGSKYRYRKDTGILGNITVARMINYNNKILDEPCYYRGFWFNSISKACQIYSMNIENLRKEIKIGRYEESSSIQDFLIVKKYVVFGVEYNSIKEAAAANNISTVALTARYYRNKNPENYTYSYIKEVINHGRA